jgi:hypothetical protein
MCWEWLLGIRFRVLFTANRTSRKVCRPTANWKSFGVGRASMQDDHYVAQTYLRHFVGPSRLLCAVRKSDGRSFPCRPRGVCHEPDGDIIPDFLLEPKYLGEYRSAFEPSWNRAVSSLKAHSIGMRDKLNIAGYWANLMVCTPTWEADWCRNLQPKHSSRASIAG